MPEVICVDIDGTLTLETEGWGNRVYSQRTPRKKIIELVNELYKEGNTIVLWSSRYPEDEQVTKEWLKKHNVKYTKLLLGKPQYDKFIDDKVINVNDIDWGFGNVRRLFHLPPL